MAVWVARELQVTTQGQFMALTEHSNPPGKDFMGKDPCRDQWLLLELSFACCLSMEHFTESHTWWNH